MNAAISGMGVVSAAGSGRHALWARAVSGHHAILPIRRFETSGIAAKLAGIVPSAGRAADGLRPSATLCVEFATEAAQEAVRQAQLTIGHAGVPSHRIALLFGASMVDHDVEVHVVAQRVADDLGITGPLICFSSACASSTNAIGAALDILALDAVDAVIAGGADVLTPLTQAGFNALGLLSPAPCAPFSEPLGTSLGEGAAFFVVENEGDARERGAAQVAILEGYGLSADAYHDTGPDPCGAGVARALTNALRDARVAPGEISYINMHATGTAANDPAEWRGVCEAFGARADHLPASGSKSIIGHAQGAAGAIESVVTLMGLRRQMLPPTLNCGRRRPRSPPDLVAQTARRSSMQRAVCANSAFGGANAAVVFARPDVSRARRTLERPVFWAGSGLVGAFGEKVGPLLDALVAQASPPHSRRQRPDLQAISRTLDGRGLDGATSMLTAAAARALSTSGASLQIGDRDRMGLIAGITHLSPQSVHRLRASVEARGLPFLSAHAFARMVLNAPTGTAARLLTLKGPTSTLTCGQGSGLLAVVYAAMLLRHHDAADQLIASAVDERALTGRTADPTDAAGAAVLQTSPTPIVLSGLGIAGPGHPQIAVTEACADENDVSMQFGGARSYTNAKVLAVPPSWGVAPASHSLWLFLCAAEWLERRDDGAALVVADGSKSASIACVLKRQSGAKWRERRHAK